MFVTVRSWIEWREYNRRFPAILSSKWVSIKGEGICILTFDIETTSKAINIIPLVHYSAIFCVNKWLTYLGNPILVQFTFNTDLLWSAIGIWRLPSRLQLIPVFIRSRVLISLIAVQPVDRVILHTVIVRSDETIRLSGDGNRGESGRRRRCRSAPRHDESIRLLQLSKLWNSMRRICMLIRTAQTRHPCTLRPDVSKL